jgi:phage major head subunit gpT-like protein
MPHVAANWAELLTPQLTEAFFVGFTDSGRRASLIDRIYRIVPSERAFEEHLGVGQFSSSGWNFEDSGRIQYDDRNKGYKKTFTHVEFAKGFMVQRKLMDDNLQEIPRNNAEELGDAAFRFREKAAALLFTNAFTDSGTDDYGFPIAGSDAVGLASAAHPNSPTDSAATQTNEGTLSLTKANVRTTREAHMALADDRGDILNIMPDILLVPPELEDDALEIVRSTLDPTSANNAINPQAGRFAVVVWHYLTDANAWFMIDSGRMRRDLLWYERIPVEFARDVDFETLQAKFRAYMRFSRGARDWRWLYGQNPS